MCCYSVNYPVKYTSTLLERQSIKINIKRLISTILSLNFINDSDIPEQHNIPYLH
jgi:hypothetical protein